MASNGKDQLTQRVSSVAGDRSGSEGSRVPVTVDGLFLARMLADQERLHRTMEEFLEVSVKESAALRRVVDRQEGVIASLRQEVADLSRREEGSPAPRDDSKPL